MNVRLSRGEIKFRLGSAEFLRLREQGEVVEVVSLPGGLEYRFAVRTGEAANPLQAGAGSLVFLVPHGELGRLAKAPPARDLGSHAIVEVEGGSLRITLEIDFFSRR